MTYNPNIPLSTDIPSQSQPQLLTNFQQLNSLFAVNHVTWNDVSVANRGKHTFVSMTNQAGDPATTATEMALYTKQSSGTSELFARRQGNGTVIELTKGDPVIANPGSSFLPGGVIIKWGSVGFAAGDVFKTVPFVSSFPNNLWQVVITNDDTVIIPQDLASWNTPALGSFNIVRVANGRATNYSYIAIGN